MLIKLASKTTDGIERFTFGAYRGKSVNYIWKTNPSYILWVKSYLHKNFSPEFEKRIEKEKY